MLSVAIHSHNEVGKTYTGSERSDSAGGIQTVSFRGHISTDSSGTLFPTVRRKRYAVRL